MGFSGGAAVATCSADAAGGGVSLFCGTAVGVPLSVVVLAGAEAVSGVGVSDVASLETFVTAVTSGLFTGSGSGNGFFSFAVAAIAL